MNQLNVPFLSLINGATEAAIASPVLSTLERNAIDAVSWPEYDYQPDVHFSLAHGAGCLFIKYYVREKEIRAIHRKANDPVHNDTCVEFFIAFDGEDSYYNFEFNCMGTCQAGFGPGREQRRLLPEGLIRLIDYQAKFASAHAPDYEDIYWELTLVVPFSVFCFHEITSLEAKKCKMNFYKCGDMLTQPHYLSWNKIISGQPNFHLPEYFGEAHFLNQLD